MTWIKINRLCIPFWSKEKFDYIHFKFSCTKILFRGRPFNLQGGRGYGFLFRSEFFFRTTQELEYLFFLSRQNLTLDYMT